jgi:hypothetical protein
MTALHRALMIEFDQDHHARAVFVRKDVEPQALLSLLNLTPLPRGIISISGGATDFPPEIVDQTIKLFKSVIVRVAYEHDLLTIDGGTEAGVVKIIGKVFEQTRHIIGGGKVITDRLASGSSKPLLMGFVPRAKVYCPGIDDSSQKHTQLDPNHTQLDPNHTHFVMVLGARKWGSEVECMFSFLHYLATYEKIPVINIIANGGRITLKEAYHATQQGWPVIVLEGSKRAAQIIISALDGAEETTLVRDLWQLEIVKRKSELRETLHWLAGIAQYDRITRFDLMARQLDELRKIILSQLGFM